MALLMCRPMSVARLAFAVCTAALCMAALAVSSSIPAQGQDVEPALSAAETWLHNRQNANGSYGNSQALSPRDTAQVLLALAGRETSEGQNLQAGIYLSGVPEANAA